MAEPPAKRARRVDSSAMWDASDSVDRSADAATLDQERRRPPRDDRRDGPRDDRRHRSHSRDREDRRRERSWSRDRRDRRDRDRDGRGARDRKRSTSRERGNDRRGKQQLRKRIALKLETKTPSMTDNLAQDIHQRASNSAPIPAHDPRLEMARLDRGPDLHLEDTRATVALIAEILGPEMMDDRPMARVMEKMKWTWTSRKMPTRTNSRL